RCRCRRARKNGSPAAHFSRPGAGCGCRTARRDRRACRRRIRAGWSGRSRNCRCVVAWGVSARVACCVCNAMTRYARPSGASLRLFNARKARFCPAFAGMTVKEATSAQRRHSCEGRNRTSTTKLVIALQRLQNSRIQVPPLGIALVDQAHLPAALPSLERLLAQDRRLHRRVKLVPDQGVGAITVSKTFHHVVLVLPDAFDQVAGNTDIQDAVLLARQHVDAGLSPVHGYASY